MSLKMLPFYHGLRDRIFSLLIVLLVLLYSWRMMLEPSISQLVAGLKLLILLCLFFFALYKKFNIPKFSHIRYYLLFFLLFILSALLSSLLAPNVSVTLVQWVKLFSRWIMALGILIILLSYPRVRIITAKILVIIGCFAFACYLITYFIEAIRLQSIFPGIIYFFRSPERPFGILGSVIHMPNARYLLRMTSFWLEPSKAAGFLLSTTFLAFWLYCEEKRILWKWLGIVCLLAGLATLSNAGYMALGIVLIAWGLKRMSQSIVRWWPATLIVIGVGLILFGVFGRIFMVTYHVNNPYFMGLVGARPGMVGASVDRITGGRFQLVEKSFGVLGVDLKWHKHISKTKVSKNTQTYSNSRLNCVVCQLNRMSLVNTIAANSLANIPGISVRINTSYLGVVWSRVYVTNLTREDNIIPVMNVVNTSNLLSQFQLSNAVNKSASITQKMSAYKRPIHKKPLVHHSREKMTKQGVVKVQKAAVFSPSYETNLLKKLQHIMGMGVQIPGQNNAGIAVDVSATAPLLWLTFTGIPGLVLLLLTLIQIIRCYFSSYLTDSVLYVFCAWTALGAQELVYGDWIDPHFIFLSCMVLACFYQSFIKQKRNKNEAGH